MFDEKSSLGEILSAPNGAEVIEEFIPGFQSFPMIEKAKRLPIKKIAKKMKLTQEQLQEILDAVNQ
jgi:hypothetical protein